MSRAARRIQSAVEALEGIRGGVEIGADALERVASGLERARALREEFLRRPPSGQVRRVTAPDPVEGPLYELGELAEIVYQARKGRDRETYAYQHAFLRPRPRLAATADGGLVIVGGSYRITSAGIEH